jgi:serine/threonine protein kinase
MDGLICGRYRTVSKLGEGGMADVWLAKHEMIEQEAAVKLLQPHMSENQEVVRRFLKEAQAAAAIKHPGIVEIYDVGHTTDGRAYIVMELLRGEPLGERLSREGQLSIEQTTRLMRQLAGVMDAAHEKRIFHRDLKPDNLFVAPDPEVQGGERIKVLDFGLAKLASEYGGSIVTSRGAVFGTPAYMAPEQCKDSGRVDGRADLYSIGCIFYRCLCGRPPFDYKETLALLQAQLKKIPKSPRLRRADIPAEVDALIMRLLAKEPNDRVQTCTELIAALDGDPDGTATLIDGPDPHKTWRPPGDTTGAREPSTDPSPQAPAMGEEAVTLLNLGSDSSSSANAVPRVMTDTHHAETERVAVHPALLHPHAATGQPDPARTQALLPRPGTAPAPMAHGSNHVAPGRRAMTEPTPRREQPRHRPHRQIARALFIGCAIVIAIVAAALFVHLSEGDPKPTDTVVPDPVLVPTPVDAGLEPRAPADATAVIQDAALPDATMPADAAPPDAAPAKTVQRPVLDKSEIDALLAQSRDAYRSDDYQAAYDACRKITANQSRHAEANRLCAMSACKLGKGVRTVKRYSRVLAAKEREMVTRLECKLRDH